jgi:magnesium chelatase subunit I
VPSTRDKRKKKDEFHILPFTRVVGQVRLKQALELVHVAPAIGGVLISGERGTAKSTVVRAFARMMHGDLPVTLPINATEDRVVGGWQVESLLKGKSQAQKGLLESADGKLLYVDEINLLDDHLVNLILDVASTGVLEVQREGFDRHADVRFTLVGTMNPEEGGLRPQLLDRFGLMVGVTAETDPAQRRKILNAVLAFDDGSKAWASEAAKADAARRAILETARELRPTIKSSNAALDRCIALVKAFEAQGHRGERAMALAAQAKVALELAAGVKRSKQVEAADVDAVAQFALQHRRPKALRGDAMDWTEEDTTKLRASAAAAH